MAERNGRSPAQVIWHELTRTLLEAGAGFLVDSLTLAPMEKVMPDITIRKADVILILIALQAGYKLYQGGPFGPVGSTSLSVIEKAIRTLQKAAKNAESDKH